MGIKPTGKLPPLPKIYEQVMNKRRYLFLKSKLHIDYQYGFRHKHSTINAVTEYLKILLKSWTIESIH